MAKNVNVDLSKLTPLEYKCYFCRDVQEYTGLLNADSLDLTDFRKAGGNVISYHGMADQSIQTKGSEEYYRYFEAPGLGHCSGGKGGQPLTTFDALRRWVEEGVAPETLPVRFSAGNGTERERILCPYPAKAIYNDNESFECVSNNTKSAF